MTRVFADAVYYLALLNADDELHAQAVTATRVLTAMVTKAWVLTEVADAFCNPRHRARAFALIQDLLQDPHVVIAAPTMDLFMRGLQLYQARPDKSWSLTDCISFTVMSNHGVTDALTADQHFRQAGFKALLA